jgi:hypothetical protein
MKYINNKLVIAILSVVLSFNLTSCVDDLNVTPVSYTHLTLPTN